MSNTTDPNARAAHSEIVGGSSAGRLLNCPASYQTTIALPASANITSDYAEEGSHLHAVMDELMRARQQKPKTDLYEMARTLVGKHFYDRELSKTHLDEAVHPALDALAELEKHYGGKFKVVGVEKQVRFPGIPGAFGTADLFLESTKYLLLPDWKFGSGVPVSAVYRDEQGELVNPQIMFYMTAAKATLPALFKGAKKLVGAIIQPRTETPLTHTEIQRRELRDFAEDLELAIIEAVGRDPRRAKGEHCRFAPCKVKCELWTGPLLDLSAVGIVPQQRTDHLAKQPTDYGNYLAACKALVDALIVFKPTLDEQLHSFLEAGGIVPGWKLKLKNKNRQWVDEDVVVPALKKLGFTTEEIWQKKLQTFVSVDATAKRRNVHVPDNLRVAPVTNETTICAESDPAPKIERAQAVENFKTALKKLTAA